VVIASPDDKKMTVVISKHGTPIEVVPLELIDAVTIECTKKGL